MTPIIRNAFIVIALLLLSVYAVIPPEKTLRFGKDLAGGVSLVYSVRIDATEDPKEVMAKTIEVLKRRIDPDGLMEISIVAQGRDRIEITMPLPSDKVKALKKKFDDAMTQLGETQPTPGRLDLAMRAPSPEDRARQLETMAAGNPARLAALRDLAARYDASVAARRAYDAETDPAKKALLAEPVAQASIAFDTARQGVLDAALSAKDIRHVAQASRRQRPIRDAASQVMLPSPRELAEKSLRESHPDAGIDTYTLKDGKTVKGYALRQDARTITLRVLGSPAADAPAEQTIDVASVAKTELGEISRLLALWEDYARERKTLDDPQDLIRLLKGAGVLTFRIAVDPEKHPDESRLRRELREVGPRNVRSSDARWYKLNQIEGWVRSKQDADLLARDPNYASAFFARQGYVVEPYEGDYYMLIWDTRTTRLTPAEGNWSVARSFPGADNIGRPAIHFTMDTSGAVLLDALTRQHVGEKMAVLLDDEVYTAPNLKSAIGAGGIIEGDFQEEEIKYVVRVLSAGSLQAKLAPEPISINSVGPQLGADNLRKGLTAGLVSLALVAGFMIVYYYGSGMIAVVALLVNAVLIIGAMAASKAAFTMPGIAGVILTFGQAVDSNVLIYERMREEFQRGADMKTAVRLGFSRALSPILDGNVSNLIICVVLYYFGTQEIRGFAITLGIGVVTTLITALVVSRLIFSILVDHLHWRKTSQLPMSFPWLQRLLTPHVDWMKHRHVLLWSLVAFLALSAVIIAKRGTKMLGTEFRGGTEVELQFRTDHATGQPVTLKRAEVHQRLAELAREAPLGDELRALEDAEVLPVNPASDGVTSSRFRIRTGPPRDQAHADAAAKAVLAAIAHKFDDVTESQGALAFAGAGNSDWRSRAFPIVARNLGDNIERPAVRDEVVPFLGGAAVLIDRLEPAPTLDSLRSRLDQMRQQPEYADTLSRAREVQVLEGDEKAVRTAVLLVRDEGVSAFDNNERWEAELASREWRLVNDALTRTSQLASVQTFSPTIAATFATQAILTVVISLFLLTVYVWIRFGAARWAVAATVPLFADMIGIAGMLGLAEVLYDNPSTGDFARSIGLLPFKFDLAQIAALLTIIGYSLNDKIIILDRIRENKGKLPFATYAIVNDSINQTLSRTLITAGGHMVTTVILYLYGGEAVRGFAFSFNLGVVLGTYTSIVSSPLVWSRKYDREIAARGGIVA